MNLLAGLTALVTESRVRRLSFEKEKKKLTTDHYLLMELPT